MPTIGSVTLWASYSFTRPIGRAISLPHCENHKVPTDRRDTDPGIKLALFCNLNFTEACTVRISRENPCAGGGGGSALVRWWGNLYWWVD
jgi:hypothetical protein